MPLQAASHPTPESMTEHVKQVVELQGKRDSRPVRQHLPFVAVLGQHWQEWSHPQPNHVSGTPVRCKDGYTTL